MTLSYAVHQLSGIVSPANAAYSTPELIFQLKNSGAKALFTVNCLDQYPLYRMAYLHALVSTSPRNVDRGSTVRGHSQRANLRT
jgi:hypothetical protein